MKMQYPYGAMPLDPNEIDGLKLGHITTQGELNEAEATNIAEATLWALQRKRFDFPTIPFIKRLHKRMFGQVWKWAGEFRKSNKNIGVDWYDIPSQLKLVCDDTKYWIENSTYDWVELTVRFHHRLVSAHPFPNGNGRFARLMANLLLKHYDQKPLTWGATSLVKNTDTRKEYIQALREADKGNFKFLINFAIS